MYRAFNTIAAKDVLTRTSLKLFTVPGTFIHVQCVYDYIVIPAFDVTLFFITIGLHGEELILCSHE